MNTAIDRYPIILPYCIYIYTCIYTHDISIIIIHRVPLYSFFFAEGNQMHSQRPEAIFYSRSHDPLAFSCCHRVMSDCGWIFLELSGTPLPLLITTQCKILGQFVSTSTFEVYIPIIYIYVYSPIILSC